MKRQRLISQRSLSRMFQEAAEAWRSQAYQQSIDILEHAARLDPANPGTLLDLARAYGMRYDFPAAERCLEKAIRVAPNKAKVLVEAGQRCREFGNDAMAKTFLEKAATQDPVAPDALVALSEIYERSARLDQAKEEIARALSLQPGHPAASLTLARLNRLQGQLEEAASLVRSLIGRAEVGATVRIRAWYELGAILDRRGQYDEAMSAFLEAKALLRPAATSCQAALQGVQARIREMEKTVSSAVLERWFELAESLRPPRRLAVLCGHPRSGTTLLEQVLDAHPEVVTAEETHILHDEAYLPLTRGFSPDASVLDVLESAPTSALNQSRDNYFRCTELFIGKSTGDKLLLDKNPALNVLIPAVARFFPEARFLIAIRDPRDVCLSCFMQALPLNPVSSAYLSLEGTVTQYASVMGFWRALLPRLRNPFIEIRYEDVVGDLAAVSRQTLAFLGLDWNDCVLRFHEHARGRLLRSPSYAEVTQPVFRSAVQRWRHYEKYLEPWLERLDPFIRAYGYD